MKNRIIEILNNNITESKNDYNKIYEKDFDSLANELLEAINYTRCCEELKDKKAMTFEEWVESEGYTEKWDGYFKNGIKSTYWIVKGKYVMYTNELNL